MVVVCCEQGGYNQNDRRVNLIDQIRRFVSDIEIEECSRSKPRRSGPCGPAGMPNMDLECREFRKRRDCTPPTITAISVHETRPTSKYSEMKHENSSQLTYIDASNPEAKTPMPPAPWELPRTPSQELRASSLYVNCDCLKRNGLQLDCPRWECGGRPECVAINPGPCCEPSKTRKPVRGDRRTGGQVRVTDCSILCRGGATTGGSYPPNPPTGCRDLTTSADSCKQSRGMMVVVPVPEQPGVSRVRHTECVSPLPPTPGGIITGPPNPRPQPTGIQICYQGGSQGQTLIPIRHPNPPPTPCIKTGPPATQTQTVRSGGEMMCICTRPTQTTGNTTFNPMPNTGIYLVCCENKQVC